MGRVYSAVLAAVVLAGCGSATSPTPSPVRSQTPSPVASGGPCASVRQTTPIEQVPPACAALWQPYGVTKVPPPDILQQEHVPPAPRVVNKTNGAVSDAEAQHWAEANNRDSGWVKWADAYGQPYLLPHLMGPALIGPVEEEALEHGATIADPDCVLFSLTSTLYPVGAEGKAYFARNGLPADADFVFVESVPGPCASVATYPDGHQVSIPQTTGPETVFSPGELRHDPLLGDLWFTDAGGNCADPVGPPQAWCGR